VIVLDTSGLQAALDADGRQHERARLVLDAEDTPLLLSPFVLAELDYLLLTRVGVQAERALLEDVAAGAYELVPFGAEAAALIDDHREPRIGLADASIAVIAARSRTTRLLTLDARHFRPVRPLWGEAFTLLPGDGR
jgi:uncharacterized protein